MSYKSIPFVLSALLLLHPSAAFAQFGSHFAGDNPNVLKTGRLRIVLGDSTDYAGDGTIETSYSETTGLMTVTVPFSTWDEHPDADWVFQWRSSRVVTGSYMGQNAFGTHFKVTTVNLMNTNIDAHFPSWLPVRKNASDGITDIVLEIAMTPDEASELNSPRVLLVGDIISPPTFENHKCDPPTFSYPVEQTVKNKDVHISLEELWLFDSKTGHVFKKFVK